MNGAVAGSVKNQISLATWNVQTFFDGEKDGTEYDEFKKASSWNREKYSVRVKRLCEAMKSIDADVFVFEEIENEGVLLDLTNQLVDWSYKDLWKYSCFARLEGSGIGIGVLSRYELRDMTVHSVDLRGMKNEMPLMRPLVEVTVDVNGKDFILFANHWKSMTGSREETEIWRQWQEFLLGRRLMELKGAGRISAVICGDFNRDISAFIRDKDCASNVLLRCCADEQESISVRSLWFNENGVLSSDVGSYYFQERWERIDNIFTFGDIEVLSFGPLARTPWATDEKIPFSYKLSNGEGYSDHLPLLCKFRIK